MQLAAEVSTRPRLPQKGFAKVSAGARPAAQAVAPGLRVAVAGLAAGLTRRRCKALDFETDDLGLKRLAYSPSGWSTWEWRSETQQASFQINYVSAGPETGERLLLVHGFGASSYHWRYQAGSSGLLDELLRKQLETVSKGCRAGLEGLSGLLSVLVGLWLERSRGAALLRRGLQAFGVTH